MILKRQVSTEWKRVREFLEEVRNRSVPEGGFVAIVEVCGFNDWFLKLLAEYGCRETVLVQPEKRSKNKTDRRDANALGELLWTNRQRLLAGKKVQNVRRIVPPSQRDAEDRQLTALRQRTGPSADANDQPGAAPAAEAQFAAGMPDQGVANEAARKWLAKLPLGTIDRLELDQLLAQWELYDQQMEELEAKIRQRQAENQAAAIDRHDPRRRGLRQPGLGLPDRFDRAISPCPQPGPLLGPDARMQELRRRHATSGLDHQGGQRHGAIHPRADGAARVASRRAR